MARPKQSIVKALKTIDTELAELRQKRVDLVLRPFYRERSRLYARIEKINQVVARALGKLRGESKIAKNPAVSAKGKGKRIRRSSRELKKIALGVVEFVKSKGKEGVTPKEIKAAFGNLFPSPSQFVKKYGGVQLRQKGPPKRPRYFGS
jgi:hypothetical protein